MKECIEIEYSDDYRRGYEDGVESFRPKFVEMKEMFESRLSDRDQYIVHLETKNESLLEVLHGMAMKVEKLEVEKEVQS